MRACAWRGQWQTLAGGCMVWVASCAPLTFSNPGGLDFERYQSVYVSVDAPDLGGEYAEQYLASQLRENSGFARVTTDPAVPVDLTLEIFVRVTAPPDTSTLIIAFGDGDIHADSDDEDDDYDATAAYTATTEDGAVVDFGVQEDSSFSALEAVQDVLDEVDLRYLKPYRL